MREREREIERKRVYVSILRYFRLITSVEREREREILKNIFRICIYIDQTHILKIVSERVSQVY